MTLAQGHDVFYGSEFMVAETDATVLKEATTAGRVVLTNDLDFGELVFHAGYGRPE